MKPNFRLRDGMTDLIEGFRRWETWSVLGWNDIRQRYRRSTIGPFWLTLSMGITIAGFAYLFAGLFGQALREYLPFVTLGMVVFGFISATITEGSTVFITSSHTILQIKIPLSAYIYQMVWRNLLIFFHNITIYVLLFVVFGISVGWGWILAALGLLLIAINGVWLGIILGGLGARFRDIPPIVTSITQIAFVLSPIFWMPEQVPNRALFVLLNPVYYLIEIVRLPLLGKPTPIWIWGTAIGINCCCAIVAILFYSRFRHRIAYWV